jgi:hypothetical protein
MSKQQSASEDLNNFMVRLNQWQAMAGAYKDAPARVRQLTDNVCAVESAATNNGRSQPNRSKEQAFIRGELYRSASGEIEQLQQLTEKGDAILAELNHLAGPLTREAQRMGYDSLPLSRFAIDKRLTPELWSILLDMTQRLTAEHGDRQGSRALAPADDCCQTLYAMTQVQFANRVGVHVNTIKRWAMEALGDKAARRPSEPYTKVQVQQILKYGAKNGNAGSKAACQGIIVGTPTK